MTLTVRIELGEADLARGRRLMQEAREVSKVLSRNEIVEASSRLLKRLRQQAPPAFVLERLCVLETLTEMAEDETWPRSRDTDRRVLEMLVSFCEPVRLLRDSPRAPSYLDDALAIELIREAMRVELSDYRKHREGGSGRGR